jgi:hypothetical protein
LRRRGVVRLEDAVGLVEADGYADGEEAGEEDEGLAARSYREEIVEGLGRGGVDWGGRMLSGVSVCRGVVWGELCF